MSFTRVDPLAIPPMITMLPSGSATLSCRSLFGQALSFTRSHGPSYVSSPKYHVHPSGSPVDSSVNFTVSGAGPESGVALNPASGGGGVTVI
ncbi:MAG: hypothetical protein BWX50_00608 [Euryarchaeota archaeon ADurb.Bin009]|nr:MAG: hypothetical protein BWX50_00608 [Euryarchaeota archaeon ADurb.Bin009]